MTPLQLALPTPRRAQLSPWALGHPSNTPECAPHGGGERAGHSGGAGHPLAAPAVQHQHAAPRPAQHSLGPTRAQAAAHAPAVAAGCSSAPGVPHGSPECLGAHEPKVLRGGWGVRQRGRAGVLPWTVLLQGVSQPLLGVGRADCMKWSAAIVPVQRRAARAAPPSYATTKNGNLITTVQSPR